MNKVPGTQPHPSVYILRVAASLLLGQTLCGPYVSALQRNRTSRTGVDTYMEREIYVKDSALWLSGPAGWRPREELMLQFESEGCLEAEFLLHRAVSVFSILKAFH